MSQVFRYSTVFLAPLLAVYVIVFHGFDAVTKQVTSQMRFHGAGISFSFSRAATTPIGF
jgi:hypothetical protein